MENTIFTELMEFAVLNNDFLCWQPGSVFLLMLPFLPGTAEGLKILPKIHSAALHRNTPKIYLNKEPRWRLFTGYIFILNFIIIGVKKRQWAAKRHQILFFHRHPDSKKEQLIFLGKKKKEEAWPGLNHSTLYSNRGQTQIHQHGSNQEWLPQTGIWCYQWHQLGLFGSSQSYCAITGYRDY